MVRMSITASRSNSDAVLSICDHTVTTTPALGGRDGYKIAHSETCRDYKQIKQHKIYDTAATVAAANRSVDNKEIVQIERRNEYQRLEIETRVEGKVVAVRHGNCHHQLGQYKDDDDKQEVRQ